MKNKLKETIAVMTWLLASAAAMAEAPAAVYTLATIEDAAFGAKILAGDYTQAIDKIAARGESTLSDEQDRFFRNTNLCVAHTMLGEFEDAKAVCDAAVIEVTNAKQIKRFVKRRYLSIALSNRGVMYAVMGDAALARQDFVAAIESGRRVAVAKTNLGRLEENNA